LDFWSLFLNPLRIQSAAVGIRPSTYPKFHNILKKRKYRLLYSSGKKEKPGPKGPSAELIQAIVELKQRNPRFGCLRIAQQINKAFETNIDKDLVRRVQAAHYRTESGGKRGIIVDGASQTQHADLSNYSWLPHSNGLYQNPIAV
jgi:putative transposase